MLVENKNNKIYYNVSVDTDGLGWIWLDEELTKSILYKVDASSVKIYCSKNTADDGGNIPTRVGHVMFWQIGEDCSLAKTVLVTQNGGEASYSYSVLGEESIYITEETTGIRNYVIDTIDSTNVNFIGYYSADVVVTKTINGNNTAIQKEVNILLSSTNFPDFFEWGDVTEPSGLTKVNNIGGYRAIGGGTWQIPISLNNNGVNYIKNLFSGYTPSVTEGYGELVQTGGTAYTLLVNPILPCSRELSIELRKNNVEITDYDLTWRISGTSITGSGVTIDPNYTTEDVIYRLTIHAGGNTITGASKQPGNPLTGESVPYVFTADSNPVTIPHTGKTDMTNTIVSYYNDFCDGSILPLSLSATTQTSWINNVSISATNEAKFYLLKYNVDTYENKDEDREGEILINQEKTGLQLKLTIKQLRKPSVVYKIQQLDAYACEDKKVNPSYEVIKTVDGVQDGLVSEFIYDGTLEFGYNNTAQDRTMSKDEWAVELEDGTIGHLTVVQDALTQNDYSYGGSEVYDENDNLLSQYEIPKEGGIFKLKLSYKICNNIVFYDAEYVSMQPCRTMDGINDWITYNGTDEENRHIFTFKSNTNTDYYGEKTCTVNFKIPESSQPIASGKTIAYKFTQLAEIEYEYGGKSHICENFNRFLKLKNYKDEPHYIEFYVYNSASYTIKAEIQFRNYTNNPEGVWDSPEVYTCPPGNSEVLEVGGWTNGRKTGYHEGRIINSWVEEPIP
jgi:hypothetical protein